MPLADLSPERLALLASLKPQARPTGHEIVASSLKANGITHVYGISGTPVDETLAACGRQGVRIIATRHQQSAVQGAAAHNYLMGTLRAAVIVSAGPAVSNCATGLTVARDNHWPLLVIGGRRPLAMRDMGAFQELDGACLFGPLTKHSALVEETSMLAAQVDCACQLAMQGLPGPCYLDIAEEALHGAAAPRNVALRPDRGSVAAFCGEAIVNALQRARRPVLVVGEGVRWGEPWTALEQLVGKFCIPFITSPMARGYLPDSHPLSGTQVRNWLLNCADLVLMAGASLNWVFRHGAEIHSDATLIRLGHEPDPVLHGRTGGSEYLGEPADLLRQLLDALPGNGRSIQVDETWLDELGQQKRIYLQRLAKSVGDGETPPTPPRWLHEVAQVLPENAMTILDGSTVMAWAEHILPAEFPLARLTPGINGCMGVGLPFALAACLARPSHPVLAICGDFALGLDIMDLETAVRHRLPLVIMVSNNSGSCGRLRQTMFWPPDYPERVCQFTPGIRYDLIMQAMGGKGMLVERADQVGPALVQAFASRLPTLIQVDTRDDVPLPGL
jgi:2-hydroxyacyl-CoA lyase 1